MSKLTPKQQKFADYYIETGNGTEAARRAGYKGDNLNRIASENLSKLDIRTYIDSRMEELANKRVADQQEILELISSVLRGQERGTALVGEGMGEQSVRQVAPTVAEKIKAAELLGKRYAMWTDKQLVENITPVFVEDVPEDD